MPKRKRCKNKDCGNLFTPCPQVPHQEYCSRDGCQLARKREWNRQKLLIDADYRKNRRDAQKRWRDKNPSYSREYRDRHKKYAQSNQEQQRARNRKRKLVNIFSRIAKTDESLPKNVVLTGRYRLIPIRGDTTAKTDESIIEMIAISGQ